MRTLLPILAFFAALGHEAPAASSSPPGRTRLIVLTDIGSLTAGVAEPDDGQSMIRLMLYANDFDIEGLIATSNLGHGQRVRPDLIRRVVDAYGEARPNLLLHDDRYPPASDLAGAIKAGQPIAGPEVPVEQSVGEGKDTEGSDWIIRVVDRDDPRPVWVLIWGGSADLAQALWRVRRDRSPEDLDRFLARLRVHSIGDQDSTGPWIRDQFPGLYTITQRRAYRGMYRGGDTALVSSDWVREHIHGHGPLGDLYPDYDGGDIWSGTLGRVRGIKEGDTPSFLSLVPNGLGDPEDPWLGSWGGRFEGEGNRLADVADPDLDTSGDPDPRMSSVYRWRPAFQADFRARLDWCIRPYEQANHPPVVRIAGRAGAGRVAGRGDHPGRRGLVRPGRRRLELRLVGVPAPGRRRGDPHRGPGIGPGPAHDPPGCLGAHDPGPADGHGRRRSGPDPLWSGAGPGRAGRGSRPR